MFNSSLTGKFLLNRPLLVTVVGVFCISFSATAQTPDDGSALVSVSRFSLQDAVSRALMHDPAFRSAELGNLAGQEFDNIADSFRRPSVQISGNVGRNEQASKIPSIAGGAIENTRHYDSANLNLRLIQPIFSYDALGRYDDGKARAKASADVFENEKGLFIERIIQRYVEVAQAKAALELSIAHKHDLEKKLDISRRRLEEGDGTTLEIYELDTALRRWAVTELRDEASLRSALRALGESVGSFSDAEAAAVFDKGEQLTVALGVRDEWLRVAEASSSTLSFARKQIEIAEAAVKRAKAAIYPRLDAFVSHAINDSDSVNTVNQKYETSTIGLQVSLPLYSGGGALASLRQAEYRRDQSKADYDKALSDLRLEIYLAFDQVNLSGSEVVALEFAEESANSAVDASTAAYEAGVESVGELIDAQMLLSTVQREKLQARYNLIMAIVSLNKSAGLLDAHIVDRIDMILDGDTRYAYSSPAVSN